MLAAIGSKSGRPGEFRPRAPTERSVNLSVHGRVCRDPDRVFARARLLPCAGASHVRRCDTWWWGVPEQLSRHPARLLDSPTQMAASQGRFRVS
jgi:hypothetical protein